MKFKALIIAILIFAPMCAAEGQVIKMDIEYDQGKVSLQDYTVTNGYLPPQTSGDAEYLLRITNSSSTVYSNQFNINRQVNIDGPDGGGVKMLNKTSKRIISPYSQDSEKIEIYRDRKKIIEENISEEKIDIEIQNNETENQGEITNQSQKTTQKESGGDFPWTIVSIITAIIIFSTVIYLSIVPEKQ